MRRVILIILVCAVVVAFVWWMAGWRGTVAAQVGATSVSAAIPAVALALMLGFVVLYFIIRGIAAILRFPRRWRRRRAEHRQRDGEKHLTRTWVALAARDPAEARREVARARRCLGDSPQALVLAAEAARLAGDQQELETAYRALAANRETAFLGLRGLMREAIAREDWQQAEHLAREAENVRPGTPWLRTERAQIAVRTGHWRDALALTDADAPKAALATAAAEAEPGRSLALRLGKQAWYEDRSSTPAALAYARRLREAHKEGKAQDVIRRTWAAAPNPELAEFALATAEDSLERVRQAERLAQENPDHPESELLLARVLLEDGQLDEARRHAEAAEELGLNQHRLWMLIADIEEAAGHTEAHRTALRRAANADPDPVWRCSACTTVQPRWHAACPVCGAVGSIAWGAPIQREAIAQSTLTVERPAVIGEV
ncbi:MAG: tetratricopeptide repeat protein [Acetobacteraceae bacterium]|nr:tetratricopeptide repeat protein [Acetobacteraceae bacterium]